MTTTEQFDTIIIGAGQAGLATGYHLARQGQKFVILEGHDQVGDVWRKRYDSLRLYTPSQYNGLPGMPMPLPRWSFPGRDDMASYLESYSSAFDLPVRTGARVDGLAKAHGRYIVSCGEQLLEADNVVIASGGWQQPKTPDFAVELDPQICQLHSSAYRNPDQLQEGPVLIVGCSHSGADLALELAETHQVTLSGPVRGEIPFDIEGRVAHLAVPLLWFAANHVLTQRTPIGRKMRAEVRSSGGPLLRVKRAHLEAAGVARFDAKTVAVHDGKPVLEDGQVLDVRNVIWCTGFGKDTTWMNFPVNGADGWPAQQRGESPDHPGLYFVGIPFQFAFASMLVGGAGRDAEEVARRINRSMSRRRSTPSASQDVNAAPVGR